MLSSSDAYLALVRSNYRAYVYHTHEGRWKPGKAVSYLCDEVQRFIEEGPTGAYQILVISLPPQHGKSMTITETLPAWYLCKHQEKRVIEISYSEDFAQLFGRRNKAKIERFGGLFGVRLAASPNSNTEFELSNQIGGMISRGILSGVTGRPADLMIIDDPIKTRQEADSETIRERIWDEWENSFKTRLQAGAKVIVIQTRWHEDDLAGRMIAREGERVRVINLPCEAEENDPLGRDMGDSLCPEIGKGNEWLQSYKASYMTQDGARAWNALFQGRPTAAQGNLIRSEWWKYYDTLPKMMRLVLSVDATFKDGKNNDFVAIQVWGKRDSNIYLVDALKAHLDFPDTCKAIEEFCSKYPKLNVKLIEDKANGPAIIQMLGKRIPGIVAVNPEGGKIARANAVSGAIEAGNVYLPKYASFTGDFVDECSAFPNGVHDDQVDCMTQALNRLLFQFADSPTPPEPPFPFHLPNQNANPLGKGEKVHVI